MSRALLGIGTAALAVPYGPPGAELPPPDRSAALRTLLTALERGVRFFDTAPAYGDAEALVGEALGRREDCTVASKLAIPPGGWGSLSAEETRAHVRTSLIASLSALRRERLDVLQIHNAQAVVIRRGAVVQALVELRQEGLVSRLGATVYGEVDALAAVADPEVDVVQIAFDALDRRGEHRVLPAAAAAGKAVVARSLLLHGVLSPAGRDLDGSFAALGAAADAVRVTLGASWEELPGAAVAFAASHAGIAYALLGPRDAAELTALLDGVERFGETIVGLELPTPALPNHLLDPSRWPAEAAVGG